MRQPKILSSTRDRMHGRTAAQLFCLLAGGLLVIRGVSVLLPGPSFGFPGEGWHAMFHLLSGVVLLFASRGAAPAYRVLAGFALAYGIVAIVGTVDGHDVLGVIPIDTRDNVIHAAYVALAVGVLTLGPHRVCGEAGSLSPSGTT